MSGSLRLLLLLPLQLLVGIRGAICFRDHTHRILLLICVNFLHILVAIVDTVLVRLHYWPRIMCVAIKLVIHWCVQVFLSLRDEVRHNCVVGNPARSLRQLFSLLKRYLASGLIALNAQL